VCAKNWPAVVENSIVQLNVRSPTCQPMLLIKVHPMRIPELVRNGLPRNFPATAAQLA
jgi:hypothetical protein